MADTTNQNEVETTLTQSDIDLIKDYLSKLDDLAGRDPIKLHLPDLEYEQAQLAWMREKAEVEKQYRGIVLKAIFHVIDTAGGVDQTPDSLRDLLEAIIEQSDTGTGLTDKLLSNAYLPMLTGALVNDLMQVNTRGLTADKHTKKAVFTTKDGHKITIDHFDKLLRGLSTPAKKILNTSIMFLTATNYYNADRVTPIVEIPLIEYGERCGYQLTPRKMATPEEQAAENKAVDKRIKEFKKAVRNDLRDIKEQSWTAAITKGRNTGDYKDMTIISSHGIINGQIRIVFDMDAATFLVNGYVMQHPMALLAVDNRNPNAYALGYKIAQHNSMDTNAAKGTNNTLSVESLLAAAPEIQTIDDLKAKGQRNWKDKIKRPLENALNELVKVRVLNRWEYRDPATGTTYTPETAQKLTWAQYIRLMVDFVMINAPDQTARRSAKAELPPATEAKDKPRRKRKKAATATPPKS